MLTVSLVVLFGVGVVWPYALNFTAPYPMGRGQQERRICAELCRSGLGGDPCGESCEDLVPHELAVGVLPSKSNNDSLARRDACQVLCPNNLGYPLCGCMGHVNKQPFFKVDFYEICSSFCHNSNYSIDGCGSCDLYPISNPMVALAGSEQKADKFDWNGWCITQCKKGMGGSACYCDLLPLSMHV